MSKKSIKSDTSSDTPIELYDLKIKSLGPAVENKYKSLIPAVLTQEYIEFSLSGINNAIANGLRRTILGEILGKAMNVDPQNIKTDNPFIINTLIQKRIRLIPILQSVPNKQTFTIDVINKTDNIIHVLSDKLIPSAGNVNYFDATHEICTLEPGKFLKISNVHIEEGYPYNFSGFGQTYGATAIPLEQMPPPNMNNSELLKDPQSEYKTSSMSNPTKYKIGFGTNGTSAPKEIVKMACKSIIDRIGNVIVKLNIISAENLHTIELVGESDTIGNLFMKTAVLMSADELVDYDLAHVTYDTANDKKALILKVLTAKTLAKEAIIDLFTAIFKKIISQFIKIQELF